MGDREVVDEQIEAYGYYRDNGHIDYLNKARLCENYFAGTQWDSALKARLERRKLPAMTINKVLTSMMAVMGEQINNRIDVSFRPSASGDPMTAAALDKLWLHVANDNKLDWVESQVFDDALITGRGFFDIRMDFDRHLRGEIKIIAENPLNVMVDPDAEEYAPEAWKGIITTKWLSLDDISRMYGKDVAKELRGRKESNLLSMGYDSIDTRFHSFAGKDTRQSFSSEKDNSKKRLYRVIERQMKEINMVEHFVDLETSMTKPIPQHWERDQIVYEVERNGYAVIKRRSQQCRWITTIDDVLAHNEISPYLEFTKIPYFPVFRRGTTIGLVENMIDAQNMYNKTLSQMFHIVNTTANSGWKVKSGGLRNLTIEDLESKGAETGLVLELDDINSAEKIQPNQVPTGLDRLQYLLGEDIKETSMVSDSIRGFDRADVAARAIEAKKIASSNSFAKPLDNLKFTRQLVAERVLCLLQDWYTDERTYRITGGGLNPSEEEMTINQVMEDGSVLNDLTVGEYSVTITAVPARTDYEDSQFEEAMRMREVGISIPDHVVIEHSHLNRKAEVANDIKQRTGYGEQTEIEKQMQMLEQQIKQLEAQRIQAENQKIQSETALNQARAQATMVETAQGPEADNESDKRMILEREKAALNARLDKYKIDQELAIKREELMMREKEFKLELAMKRAEASQRLEVEKQKAEQVAKAARSPKTTASKKE